MKKLIYIFIFLPVWLSAQEKDNILPKGNEAFMEKKYAEAEADYRVSQSKFAKASSAYNLGNSIYRQKQVSEAKKPFLAAIKSAKTYQQKHMAFHNLGNVYMKEKKYTEAVEAYKNALRNDPKDEETRYNLALAKKFLKDNPPPKDKKDKKDDKKEDKKKDQKKNPDQDKKEDKPKEPEEKEKDKDGKPEEKPQPKPAPSGISKERVKNLLDAVNNEEKKVQEKVNAKKVKAPPVRTEKDW